MYDARKFARLTSLSPPLIFLLGMTLILPTELLLDIRDRFGEWDLRTHVCYYLSHPSIAAIYETAEDPDAFWALICWHCGIGSLPTERQIRWKDVALRSIISDGFCKHPQCGEALLESNSKSHSPDDQCAMDNF